MRKFFLWAAPAFAVSASIAQVSSAQTDIVRKPSNWRGTLLEGTDALIATDKYGYPLFIQTDQTVGSMFQPAAIGGEVLAAEFKKLCIDTQFDESKLAAAATTSKLGLSNRSIQVSPVKGPVGYRANVWVSPAARVQIWAGDTNGLSKRQTLSRWRNGATMSVFRPSDAPAPSCGLTAMSTNFHDPAAFIAAMSNLIGAQPSKIVTKEPWADGFWSIKDASGAEVRITYSMTDLNRQEQLLHVGATRARAK